MFFIAEVKFLKMTSNLSEQVIQLIREIENALVIIRQHSQKYWGITLRKADLELNLAQETTYTAGGGVTFFVPVEASTEKTTLHTQKFEISLTPIGGGIDLGETESNDLAQAIIDLAETMNLIAMVNPTSFELTSGSLTIEIETTTEGKVQVVLGGSRGQSTTHKIKLMFRN